MISELAVVHPNAKLGKNVVVEPFAYITGDVEIGENTIIRSHASVLDGARIGKNCKIHSGAVIAGEPQDLKFKGEVTTAVIGDNTTVRECVTINRGTAAKGTTIVGSNCLLMAYSHVGHDCVLGDYIVLVNGTSLAGEVEIGDWAIIAGMCGVHQFTKVGAHAMVAGMSRVGKDVPPFIRAGHDPIAYVGVNSIGLRRRGFSSEDIVEIQDIYRIIFQSKLSISNAIARVENEFKQSTHRDEVLNFIKESKRGVIKPYQSKLKDEDANI